MSQELILVVVGICLTAVISFIGSLIKKVVVDKLAELGNNMIAFEKAIELKFDAFEHKFGDFKDKVLEKFVRKEEMERNNDSHKELWSELNNMKQRITTLEAKQD